MPNTFAVRTWDLMLPRLSRVLVTNPDRQLLCHFSKTVLRIPSTCTLPEKIHIASEQFEEVRRLPNRLPARGVAAFASAIRFGLLLLSAAALLIL